jgi:hypothetical protein
LAHVPTRATVALAPAAVVGVRVASRFELALTLGIRVHLDATEYREPDEPRPVLAPWRVQPTLSLALHTPLF